MAKKSSPTTPKLPKEAVAPSIVNRQSSILDEDVIEIIGAKEHNLKDISLRIPRNKLVVITGISGSGKSSLAFDTIYAEGQRRYMETFNAYARQFLGEMERPDVEQITGLSPVISIEQKTTGRNPRSTVGTITEVYDFMRLLFARVGEAYSHISGKKMVRYTEEQMMDEIMEQFNGRKVMLLAPLIRGRKGHYRELFDQMRKQGYTKIRVDGVVLDITPEMQVDRYKVHDIELVVDKLSVANERRERISASMQTALKMGNGLIMVLGMRDEESGMQGAGAIHPSSLIPHASLTVFSKHLMDAEHSLSYEEPNPNSFSFNSPYGACPTCNGLGQINGVDLAKVVPDDTKSINQEGIVPFGEVRDNYTFKQLKEIAKQYKFTFDTPVKDIPKTALDVILYGGGEAIKLPSISSDNEWVFSLAQEGLAKQLKRWYEDTSSEKIRQWAEDFMTVDTCPTCNGQRLKVESLHFKTR